MEDQDADTFPGRCLRIDEVEVLAKTSLDLTFDKPLGNL